MHPLGALDDDAMLLTGRPPPDVAAVPEGAAVRLPAAGLFLDVVGFSSVMDRLESDRGTDGIEDLLEALNACFQPVSDAIAASGGDVASVTGDGLFAIWPCVDGRHAAALSAARDCARLILLRGAAGRLPVRIAVGAGEIFAAPLRDARGGGRNLVAGPLVATLSAACAQGTPGQVLLVSPPAAVIHAEPASTATAPEIGLPQQPGVDNHEWIAALRLATILFVRLRGLACADWDAFARAGAAAATLGGVAHRHGGLHEKTQADDKGFTTLITFGMPPRAGSYGPEQAFAAAVALQQAMRPLGIELDIGIGTGWVFRGPICRGRGLDFATHGSAVHRAVRLMAAAEGRILCDAPTRETVAAGLLFEALPPLLLKGFADPVAAFALTGNEWRLTPPGGGRTALVGRTRETDRLAARLAAAKAGEASVTALLGDAGLGKTALLHTVGAAARAQGLRVLDACGSPLAAAMPYRAWRPVFLDIFGNRIDEPAAVQRARILAFLADDPAALALAPLLDAVAPVGIPENATTRAMSERARAAARGELMSQLIVRHASAGPTLIVFDDGHWLDDASVRLLADPALGEAGISVLVGCRPHEGATPLLLTLLGERPGFESVPVGALGPADSARLAAAALGAPAISDPTADWIWRAASGHPLFTAELARLLRDRGLVTTQDGVAALTVDVAALDELSLPRNVQGVVTDRLDRLGPAEQCTFRAASVIGVTFDIGLLEAISAPASPAARAPGAVRASVSRLLAAGLFASDPGGNRADLQVLAFGHPSFRAIGYEQMPREEKRMLHQAVARALEPAAETDPRTTYAILAFHYRLAREHAAALRYYDLASDLALHDGAYSAALNLLLQAARIHAADPALAAHPELPAFRCNARLARAHLALGQLDEAASVSVRALADTGYRWPGNGVRLGLGLATAVLAELAGALRPTRVPAERELQRLSAGVDAAACLSFVSYFRGRPERWMLANLWAVRFAARSGELIPASTCYGWLVMVAGLLRLAPLRRYFLRRQVINARHGGPADLRTHAVTGWLHHAHFCEWEKAERCLAEHPSVISGYDDPYLRTNEVAVAAFILYLRGDLDASLRTYASIRPMAERQRNSQHRLWSEVGTAFCLLAAGRPAEAVPLLQACSGLLGTQSDSMDHLVRDGPLAVAYLRVGDLAAAEAVGLALLDRVCAQSPNALAALEGYAGAVEVWLGLAEAVPADAVRCLALARRALRRLRLYALIFPIGRPRYWLYRGFLRWHEDAPQAARRCWQRSLAWAQRNRMPLEAARATAALATRHAMLLPGPIVVAPQLAGEGR